MLQNLLKIVFGYLTVGVNNELNLDGVKHDPSPRPLLVLRVTEDPYDVFRRAPRPPAFPNVVMAVWTGEKLSVFLYSGQRTAVCHQEDFSGIVPYEPVRTYVRIHRTDPDFLREHVSNCTLFGALMFAL